MSSYHFIVCIRIVIYKLFIVVFKFKNINFKFCIKFCKASCNSAERLPYDSNKRFIYLSISTVQYITVQYSAVPYSTVPYITVPYRTVPYITVPYRTLPYITVQYSTVQYSTVPYRTLPYSTVQYSTVQYSTVQYGTVQYSTEIVNFYGKWQFVFI